MEVQITFWDRYLYDYIKVQNIVNFTELNTKWQEFRKCITNVIKKKVSFLKAGDIFHESILGDEKIKNLRIMVFAYKSFFERYAKNY